MSLYKQYRPKRLKDVVGNEGTIASLDTLLKRENMPNVFLFTGPSGCGKTTLARIVARQLKIKDMNLIEVNGSIHNGVEDVREICKKLNLRALGGGKKMLLFDEVHRLSKNAQDAFLKDLEDTPEHVVIALCTTDPQKLLNTIITRCTPISVNSLSEEELKEVIDRVLDKESKSLSEEVHEALAKSAKGSARKALVLLDKIVDLKEDLQLSALNEDEEFEATVKDLCQAIVKQEKWTTIVSILNDLSEPEEAIRRAVLGYLDACLKNTKGWSLKNHPRIVYAIRCFWEPLYDVGKAGLTCQCYEATLDEE